MGFVVVSMATFCVGWIGDHKLDMELLVVVMKLNEMDDTWRLYLWR